MKKITLRIILTLTILSLLNISVYATELVSIHQTNTKENISKILSLYRHSAFLQRSYPTDYETEPQFHSPYNEGMIDKENLNDAENTLKMVRALAGLSRNIDLTEDANMTAQRSAMLSTLLNLSATNTNYADLNVPENMTKDFFDSAIDGCQKSTRVKSVNNISYAILNAIYAPNDISDRYRILNADAQFFGIGYADNSKGENATIYTPTEVYSDTFKGYIAWPVQGDFPIQYFAMDDIFNNAIESPWSIRLGTDYQEIDLDKVSVKLIRNKDNKYWTFTNKTTKSDYFFVDAENKVISFRPDLKSYGKITDGDTYTVQISGLTDDKNSPAVIEYDVNFYDMSYKIEFITNNSSSLPNQILMPNTLVKEPEVLKKPGYDFVGWFEDKKLLKAYDFDTPVFKDIVLYGKWIKHGMSDNTIIISADSRAAAVYGRVEQMDTAPLLINNTFMIPAWFLVDILDGDISWDAKKQEITITKTNTTIKLTIGSDIAYVNGKVFNLEEPVFVKNERTYVPLRFIAERLSVGVSWNNLGQTATLTVTK